MGVHVAEFSAPVGKPRRSLGTLWIGIALIAGVALGGSFPEHQFPQVYAGFRFLSQAFIHLIKSLIVPLLFATLVLGVTQARDARTLGRLGGKALLYFEVVTTLALGIGLLVAHWFRPGESLPIAAESGALGEMTKPHDIWATLLHLFPSNFVEHAARGDVLPVVVFALLFGVGLTRAGSHAATLTACVEGICETMFQYTAVVMKLTPLGVFGAMASNVSHMAAGGSDGVSGWSAVLDLLGKYLRVVASLYCGLGVLVGLVFLPVLWLTGVGVVRFFRAVRSAVLTAFSTASSEAALPALLESVVALGVPRRVAGFVIPAGYSFNLDGSTLYLVLATMTIAQASGVVLTVGQQVALLGTLILSAKGVAGVPRASLVIVAATCSSFGLPGEAGVAMLLAVDEVMDMARTAVNVLGNGLAAVVVAKWEGELDVTEVAAPGG